MRPGQIDRSFVISPLPLTAFSLSSAYILPFRRGTGTEEGGLVGGLSVWVTKATAWVDSDPSSASSHVTSDMRNGFSLDVVYL